MAWIAIEIGIPPSKVCFDNLSYMSWPCWETGLRHNLDRRKNALYCAALFANWKIALYLLHSFSLLFEYSLESRVWKFKIYNLKNNFIYMEDESLKISTMKKKIPGQDFIDFKDSDALKSWLESKNTNQHLVYQNYG